MNMFSEIGDGQQDAAPALQTAVERGGEVRIPEGRYLLGSPLRVPSGTSVVAAAGAVFRLADGAGRTCRDFMVTNANPGNGNFDISLRGGIWDANNSGNPRGEDGDPFSYTGVAINFTNVRGLIVEDLTVCNPESFFLRVGEVRDFRIEGIRLRAEVIRPNQDGVHVGGFSSHGVIRNIRGSGRGVPNDDMVALNADDDVERQLNLGMRRGPIRDIAVEDIEAEDAYTFIRLLSVDNPIEDITVRRLRGSCRIHGINLNNWRFPKGVGSIRRVRFEDIDLSKTEISSGAPAIIKVSLDVDELEFHGVHRGDSTVAEAMTLLIDNGCDCEVMLGGRRRTAPAATGFTLASGSIDHLLVRREMHRTSGCRRT